MKNAIVDFESYYDKDITISRMGTMNYVKASEAYCLGITVDGEEAACGTLAEMGQVCENISKDPTVKMWAANSNFDQAWWEKYFPKMVNPWGCILDLGAYHQYPRNLKDLAHTACGAVMSKDVRDEMKGVRFESLPPERQQQVLEYCLNDVVQSNAVLEALPPMSPVEDAVAEHTRACNRRGIFLNQELMEHDKTLLEEFRFNKFKSIPWHSSEKPLSPIALAKWCQSRGLEAPKSRAKDDEECSLLMGSNPEFNELIRTLRSFQSTNRLIKKMGMATDKVGENGFMPMDLMFCGAPHTRRWTSRGFNVQNLDRFPTVLWGAEIIQKIAPGVPPEVFLQKTILKNRNKPGLGIPEGVGWIWPRMWVSPKPGMKFLILDYAQVEPRITHWLAGDEPFLDQCRAGFSAYEAAARAGGFWTGKVELKHGNEELYKTIKAQEIGLGYGMGWSTYLDNNPHLGDWHWGVSDKGKPVAEGPGADRAAKEVKEWRDRNPLITRMWRKLDSSISAAAVDKDHHLAMEMRSGDLLQYFNVKSASRKGFGGMKSGYQGYVVKGDFGRDSLQASLWGGTLMENVVQRTSRDILAEAILELEKAGLPVIFTSHDEAIMEVPVDCDEKDAYATASRIMASGPGWAEGLPLAVEGGFVPWYCKM